MTTTKIAPRGQVFFAVAGVLAMVAALLGQSVDTQAQLGDTATASSSFTAKDDFWPTPVVPSTSCSPTTSLIQDPVISWSSAGTPPGGGSYTYYVTIHHDSSTAVEVIGPVNGTSVKIARNESRWNKGWHARIYTINGPKMSSGYRSEGFNLTRVWPSTWAVCSGNKAYVPNGEQRLQNSPSSDPLSFQASQLGESEFVRSAAEERDIDVEPDQKRSPLSRVANSEQPSTEADSTSRVTTTEPATTSSPTVPATSAAATSTSVKSTPSSSTPAAPSTTAQQSVRAGVGDGPIAVGASQARLDEVDGRTRLSVTRGGSEVCTAEVDGASRIDSSGGVLTVTVSGRTSPVDLETCELT